MGRRGKGRKERKIGRGDGGEWENRLMGRRGKGRKERKIGRGDGGEWEKR